MQLNSGELVSIQKVKHLMMDYIFQYVDKINFHVGEDNKRSRIAMERLGAKAQRNYKSCLFWRTRPH